MNIEKQIKKLKERVEELERLVGVKWDINIDEDSTPINEVNVGEFMTWADDIKPGRESAVELVHRLLGK